MVCGVMCLWQVCQRASSCIKIKFCLYIFYPSFIINVIKRTDCTNDIFQRREQEDKYEYGISFGDNYRVVGFGIDRGAHSFPVWKKERVSDDWDCLHAVVRAGQFYFWIVFVSSDLYCINDYSCAEEIARDVGAI